ncbi:MAG: adenine deaminase [Clostridia bacterium]|nr:adenine deaminase [Clostridia bacterium]MDH7572043.1 adenine deaminase [Clostridia bacterium]
MTVAALESLIDVARGRAPADVLITGARVVNVFTGEILEQSVAVKDGLIAGVGDYRTARAVYDFSGRYLIPGLIDAHVHIESSLLTPPQFAAAYLPHGVTAVIADPHEIANVAGVDGLYYMVEAARGLPFRVFYTVPSCVPATHMETAGAELGAAQIEQAFALFPESPGLAEMMNFPGVLNKDPEVLARLQAARERGLAVDGHAPLLGGRDLQAYAAAGVQTDHECTGAEEAREKLRSGMVVIVRQGSAAKNLEDLLPAVDAYTCRFALFGTDDLQSADLLGEGGVDAILRRAVALGLNPIWALQMATLNPARHYRLPGLGAVAPGYRADLVVVNNLVEWRAEAVFVGGLPVCRQGRLLAELPAAGEAGPPDLRRQRVFDSVVLPPLAGRLELNPPYPGARARVIEVLPGQILTGHRIVPYNEVLSDPGTLRVAVIERHGKNGNVAVGLVRGFGPVRGALASTVAHDSHNLVLVGNNTADMELAAAAVAGSKGGLAVAAGGRVLAHLPLPVAGLMSDLGAPAVADQLEALHRAAQEIGCTLPSPFMTLSFLALPVIPELKITDRGLVDVRQFALADLWT